MKKVKEPECSGDSGEYWLPERLVVMHGNPRAWPSATARRLRAA